MNSDETILIENFLKGTLTESERKAFSERLKNDIDFREKVNFEKQLTQTLSNEEWSFGEGNKSEQLEEYQALFKSDEVKNLESIIESVNADYQSTKKNGYSHWFLYSSAAAIILFVLVYFIIGNPPSTEKLYKDYLATSDLPSLVVRGENGKSTMSRAQNLFENKKYDPALSLFNEELNTSDKNKGTLYLYIGVCHMELGQSQKAEKTFDALISSELLDAPKGKWYKALLYLKMNDTKKAETLLGEISQTKTYNYTKAEQILEKLE